MKMFRLFFSSACGKSSYRLGMLIFHLSDEIFLIKEKRQAAILKSAPPEAAPVKNMYPDLLQQNELQSFV